MSMVDKDWTNDAHLGRRAVAGRVRSSRSTPGRALDTTRANAAARARRRNAQSHARFAIATTLFVGEPVELGPKRVHVDRQARASRNRLDLAAGNSD